MISSMIELSVLFSNKLEYDIDNPGFYMMQAQALLENLAVWIYVYYILRTGLLMPVYLNFAKLHLYSNQQ